jgi:hypothetical protein
VGGKIIRINEAKSSPEEKKIGTEINGKFDDLSSADENK